MVLDSLTIATLSPMTRHGRCRLDLGTATHALAMHRFGLLPLRRTRIHGSSCTRVVPATVQVRDGRQRPVAVGFSHVVVADQPFCGSLGTCFAAGSAKQAPARPATTNRTTPGLLPSNSC